MTTPIKQLVQESLARCADNAKLVRIEGNRITIRERPDDESEVFDLELSRCDTYPKILSMVLHLAEKDWMTQRLTRLFILNACHHHRLDPHAEPEP